MTEFRYAVVGGGSAGCLLARRLAEGQSGPVALFEAGPQSSDVRSVVPNYYPYLFGSSLDWRYATQPQSGLAGRRIAWPRGKMLGGSGAINAMIYMQAATADFARWGWEWAEERCTTPADTEDAAAGGGKSNANALIRHCPLESPHPWTGAFLRACQESGLTLRDSFDRSQAGHCGPLSVAQSDGRRVHSGQRLQELENLTVFTECQVERICISHRHASGVQFRDAGRELRTLTATEETVLCSGAIGSPMLLLASGIGPARELDGLGIACEHDLAAVGGNLQDHLVFPLVFQTHAHGGLARRHDRSSRDEYRRFGRGGLASNIAEAAALLASEVSAASDFQVHFTPTHYLKYPRLATDNNHLTLAVSDLHPRSRGRLTATPSGEGGLRPVIDPGYLSDASDIERMREAIAWARSLAQQPSLAALISHEILPGTHRQDARSLSKALSAFSQSIFHPVGTCRMAAASEPSDANSVVDAEFRVHGIDGLRIVDASVLPDLPSGNTNAPTLLLAARAAELLLGAG